MKSCTAECYKKTYEAEFSKLSEIMKKRVLAIKDNLTIKDRDVDLFIKDVIAKAEAQESVDSPPKSN